MKVSDLHPRKFFLEVWQELDNEADKSKLQNDAEKQKKNVHLAAFIFVIAAISLILLEYYSSKQSLDSVVYFIDDPVSPGVHPYLYSLTGWFIPDNIKDLNKYLSETGYYELLKLCFWAILCFIGFFIIPAIAIIAHPGLKFREMGLSLKNFTREKSIYVILFVPVFIAVVAVSFTDDFNQYYPFYSLAHRSMFDFLIWELFYIIQFFSLEFFFRGFMLQPLKKIMGSTAIFAMMVPYVMIHFGKPMPECFAAIIAGIVLGTLSLRTGSIWGGFFIHTFVAISMDVAAIIQTKF